MKSWLLILGVWAGAMLYWRDHGMDRDLHRARASVAHIFLDK